MIPLNRRALFGLAAAAATPLPKIALAAPLAEPADVTGLAPGYAARIGYAPPHPDEALLDPAAHTFPG